MFKNFIVIIIRNLKNKVFYSLVNILGLAVGIACSILILLWVMDELSYDKFVPKYKRLYQVWINADFDGTQECWPTVPSPAYEAMKAADHRIVNATRIGFVAQHVLAVQETKILKRGHYASPEFLEMFQFPLISGDAASVLDDPSSIVITASTALALFGEENPINKIIKVDNQHQLKVTGVLKDIPENSSFQFDFLLTWRQGELTQPQIRNSKQDWGSNLFLVYVELREGSSFKEVEGSIKNIIARNLRTDFKEEFFLYPMERWRLHSIFEGGREVEGLIEYVYLFSTIAGLILVIGCVNFMNLMTARSEKNGREVGIRKTLGARSLNLVSRFLSEASIITVVAFVVGLIGTYLILPSYNELVGKNLSLDFSSGTMWLLSMGVVIVTATLSGVYPAFYLSSLNPINSLKGKVVTGRGAGALRKMLVITQLGSAILLITGTLVIYQQISLMRERSLGYTKDKLVTIKYNDGLRQNYNGIKQALLQSGAVESMTRSNSAITEVISNNFLDWPGKPGDQKVMFATIASEYDYTETMGIKILEGRDFSRDVRSDSNAIIVNKAALDIMKLKEPIGTQFDLWGNRKTLIGVMDNVLMESVEGQVRPLFMIFADFGGSVTIRLKKDHDAQTSINTVESILTKLNPAYPFDYEFVDVAFERKFKAMVLIQKLAGIFTLMAIGITSLGLIGLISYMAEQRTKEIGIRKVFGASVANLIVMISKDFTKMVMLAFVIAAPLSWWLLERYLAQIPIRTSMKWWFLPLTGLIVLLISLLIVVFRATKAAKADPIVSLKNQ
jgi:ABC-type antimicrobial peptide transport system permease subunit